MPRIFCHCTGDGVVKTTIKGPKLIDRDGCARFEGKVGNGLADVAVGPHHLIECETLLKQFSPVLSCSLTELEIRQCQGIARTSLRRSIGMLFDRKDFDELV